MTGRLTHLQASDAIEDVVAAIHTDGAVIVEGILDEGLYLRRAAPATS